MRASEHAVTAGIVSGTDHMHALKTLVVDARKLHWAAPASLVRGDTRTFGARQARLDDVARHISAQSLRRKLLFTAKVGTPISRNSFRTHDWLPAVATTGIDFAVRVHDLGHAHASWLLAGGSDLKSVMDRMGHHQIQTTQKYLHVLPDADQRTSTRSSASRATRRGRLTGNAIACQSSLLRERSPQLPPRPRQDAQRLRSRRSTAPSI